MCHAPTRCTRPLWLAAASLVCSLPCAGAAFAAPGDIHTATTVVSYSPGTGAGVSYQNPAASLGPPTTMNTTGEDIGVVTPFRPAHLPADLVSIGRGGHLVVKFARPVYDDPRNPHGVDFIVYGNALTVDLAYPGGLAGFTFTEGGIIEVSDDGDTWHTVAGEADGGMPTMAYTDAAPYQVAPGEVPTDPSRPVDPTVTPDDLLGLPYAAVCAVYEGAAGGTNVDIASTGLASVQFVRVRTPVGAPSVPEVDAMVAVRHAFHPADLTGDGFVNGADLGQLLSAWGERTFADIDGDGAVGGADLGMLLASWTG